MIRSLSSLITDSLQCDSDGAKFIDHQQLRCFMEHCVTTGKQISEEILSAAKEIGNLIPHLICGSSAAQRQQELFGVWYAGIAVLLQSIEFFLRGYTNDIIGGSFITSVPKMMTQAISECLSYECRQIPKPYSNVACLGVVLVLYWLQLYGFSSLSDLYTRQLPPPSAPFALTELCQRLAYSSLGDLEQRWGRFLGGEYLVRFLNASYGASSGGSAVDQHGIRRVGRATESSEAVGNNPVSLAYDPQGEKAQDGSPSFCSRDDIVGTETKNVSLPLFEPFGSSASHYVIMELLKLHVQARYLLGPADVKAAPAPSLLASVARLAQMHPGRAPNSSHADGADRALHTQQAGEAASFKLVSSDIDDNNMVRAPGRLGDPVGRVLNTLPTLLSSRRGMPNESALVERQLHRRTLFPRSMEESPFETLELGLSQGTTDAQLSDEAEFSGFLDRPSSPHSDAAAVESAPAATDGSVEARLGRWSGSGGPRILDWNSFQLNVIRVFAASLVDTARTALYSRAALYGAVAVQFRADGTALQRAFQELQRASLEYTATTHNNNVCPLGDHHMITASASHVSGATRGVARRGEIDQEHRPNRGLLHYFNCPTDSLDVAEEARLWQTAEFFLEDLIGAVTVESQASA